MLLEGTQLYTSEGLSRMRVFFSLVLRFLFCNSFGFHPFQSCSIAMQAKERKKETRGSEAD
jgi:hypothetical protein